MKNLMFFFILIFFANKSLADRCDSIDEQLPTKRIEIVIEVSKGRLASDSLSLSFYTSVLDGGAPTTNSPDCVVKEAVKNGTVKFVLSCGTSLGYFTLSVQDTIDANSNLLWSPIIFLCPIEGGRKYSIRLNNSRDNSSRQFVEYFATGENSAIITCFKELEEVRKTVSGNASFLNSNLEYAKDNYIDVRRIAMLKHLEKFRAELPVKIFEQFRSDIMLSYEWLKFEFIVQEGRALKSDSVFTRLKDVLRNDCVLPYFPDQKAFEFSKFTPKTVISQTLAMQYIEDSVVDYNKVYEALVNSYAGNLRERILLYFFSHYGSAIEKYDSLLLDATRYIKSDQNGAYIQLLSGNENGRMAHDFLLPDSSGQLIRLSGYRGKVVFIDFWFTGCSPCKAFYNSQLRNVENYFRNDTNVVFITISVDKNLDIWKKSLRSGIYTSSDAVNLYTEGESHGHPVVKHYSVTGYPSPILIDQGGRIYKPGKLAEFVSGEKLKDAITTLLLKGQDLQ